MVTPISLLIASIVKDESHRYLVSALKGWSDFADRIVVIDDGSTDDTADILKAHSKVAYHILPDVDSLWGKEAPHRAALFALALGHAEEGDVILWLDADMIPATDPRKFFAPEDIDMWAFPLYDLWGRDEHNRLTYRCDGYWMGHRSSRVWAIRKTAELDASELGWPDARGIHSGHIPTSYFDTERVALTMPSTHALLHYGYYTEQDRTDRSARYNDVRVLLGSDERAHASSILDVPKVRPLPFIPDYELVRSTLE